MGNYVVTFARGFGSGGKEIASRLAKELGIHCYENRILTLASQLSGHSDGALLSHGRNVDGVAGQGGAGTAVLKVIGHRVGGIGLTVHINGKHRVST